MFIDLNRVDADPFQNKVFDVCICGGGVAGITLALHLSKKLQVLLLEAGEMEFTKESQELYKGEITGRNYFDLMETRLRYFGGTSNHWGGWCRALDAHDFEKKDFIESSGWPISRKDLEPYLKETKSLLSISEPDLPIIHPPQNPFFKNSKEFEEIKFWLTEATRFGSKYKKTIQDAKNITCALNANITDIKLKESLSLVESIKVENYSNNSFTVNCNNFILAAGGIENPRILLNCNRQIKNGLGNQHDLVGRYFMEHPHNIVGKAIFEDHIKRPENIRRFFSPSPILMKNQKLLNFGLRVYPSLLGEGEREIYPVDFKEKIRNILCGYSEDFGSLVFENDCFNQGLLMVASEQAPNHSSRVKLGNKVDKFGMRQANLDWQLSEIDAHTVRSGVINFAKSMATHGSGRVKIDDWLLSDPMKISSRNNHEIAGNHHMGTTRMGSNAHEGVVDSNQQVFGIKNFYIAGSSVFSSSGHANPTFTIVQMTLRLADFLNEKLS
jgi:choline dehydrogenase-like flavoprotein